MTRFDDQITLNIAVVVLLAWGSVLANSDTERLLIVTEDWPPYNYLDSDGNVAGISTDIVRKVMKEAALDYDIKVYPWARAFDLAATRPNIMIYSIFRSKQREPLFKWICPLTQPVPLYLYRLTSRDDIKVNTVSDARRYITGVTRGDYPHHYLLEQGFSETWHLQLAASDKANINKLLNGRVALVVEAELTMRSELKALGQSGSLVKPLLKLKNDEAAANCMAFGQQTSDKVVKRVFEALKRVQQRTKTP